MITITLPVRGMNFATCASGIEKRLRSLQAILSADASYVTQTVTVTFDERHISEQAVRDLVQDCSYACGAWRALRNRSPNMNVLVSLGALAMSAHRRSALSPTL